jgi:hypothetical protein
LRVERADGLEVFLIPLDSSLSGFAAVVPEMAEPIPQLTARQPWPPFQDPLNCGVNFLAPGFQDGQQDLIYLLDAR